MLNLFRIVLSVVIFAAVAWVGVATAQDYPSKKERLTALGAEPSSKSSEAFAQYVRDEIAKWARVVKASGAKLD